MDTDQEREAALREAERVFGANPQSETENEVSSEEQQQSEPQLEDQAEQKLEQPEPEEKVELVEETIQQLLEELGAQTTEQPISAGTVVDDQPWPDDMQIAKSIGAVQMTDTMIGLSSFDSDRPTIREKYVFRTQKGSKRQPLPSHLRWMQSLVEGRADKQGA